MLTKIFNVLNSNIVVALIAVGGMFYLGNAVKSAGGLPKGKVPTPTKAVSMDLPRLATAPVSLGTSNVVVVEYSDHQCPFCATAEDTIVRDLQNDAKTGQVRFIAREFPLAMHSDAKRAATAARCALEQGQAQFWGLRTSMLKNQKDLGLAGIVGLSDAVAGIDKARLKNCIEADKYNSDIDLDLQEGKSVGVTGTPAFLIGKLTGKHVNGVLIAGADSKTVFSELKKYERENQK
jgi:protein-disulfide isomerase